MDVIFYLVPSLILAVVLLGAYAVVRRALRIRSAWNSGLTAEGRCLRMFTTTHGGGGDSSVSTTLHHVYEFTARDGRVVRFEEENGPSTIVEGDFVTVYYQDGGKGGAEVVATAKPPRRAGLAASTVAMLAFLGVVAVFCVGFMVTFHTSSDESGFGDGTDDTTNTVVVDGVTMTP
ncbi:DUF3592 domain-containing protein [Streptomyces sp. NPDC001604]|uniref:DUF3592 domain-containing protein n=1 Tax=Streptomyces sp. NPDC001604 TaxID=3364593 RepID=UPI003682A341